MLKYDQYRAEFHSIFQYLVNSFGHFFVWFSFLVDK